MSELALDVARNQGSRNFSDSSANTGGSNSSDDDIVSELTPLVGDSSELAQERRPFLTRNSSDNSLHTVVPLAGMLIRSHVISASIDNRYGGQVCNIRPSSTKAALRAAQQERRGLIRKMNEEPKEEPSVNASANVERESYWISIETPPRPTDEMFSFLRQLRMPSFFTSRLSEPNCWATEVIALKFVSLAIFQVIPLDPNSDEVHFVALLGMPMLLVTFSPLASSDLEQGQGFHNLTMQYMKKRERVHEPSNSGLTLAWLQFHVRRTARALKELSLASSRLDHDLDSNVLSFNFQSLVDTKNCLLKIRSIAHEQFETIEALALAEKSTMGLDFSNCQGALSMLRANAASNDRISGRIDKHLNEIRERVMSHREDTLNQRMSLLTILSAVFMPLTLLTGIWGMNFEEMPELGMPGAYQKSLGGMLVLAISMVLCFYRSGWAR
mmetsp:Transcript_13531/g.31050  ORF Transcript_13531/g.31050 Transcript_13531/m.31050 type:complete len:442 (-) Transcript_13531:23-1348(-)